MQRLIFTFGAISGAVCFAVFVTGATMAINSNSAEASGVLGYLIMLVALSVIFVGIKRYRDRELGGVIRFGQAFLVGLGISLVAGVIYVACWEVYLKSTGYTFIGEYTQAVIEGKKAAGMAGEELETLIASMENAWAMSPHAFAENPVDTFKRCIYVHPFHEDDPVGLAELIGVDNVIFGSDYPHPEGLADPISFVEVLEGMSAEDTAKVMGGNLARIMRVAA